MSPESLVPQPTSVREVNDLLETYRQQLADAQLTQQSLDGRFVDAYSAAFTLAKLVVRASGYRVTGGENHKDTWLAVPWCMGTQVRNTVAYLSAARARRNRAMYDAVGLVNEDDIELLIAEVKRFEADVAAWLGTAHSELVGS